MPHNSSPTSTSAVETHHPTPTLGVAALKSTPGVTTSTDLSLPPPAYTEGGNIGTMPIVDVPPAYDTVTSNGSVLPDSLAALRKRLRTANDMFREGLISSS